MNVYELVKHLGGEIVSNKAYVTYGGTVVVVGDMASGDLGLTEDGKALAEAFATVADKPRKPAKAAPAPE